VHGQDLSRVAALGTLAEAAPGPLYPAVVWPVTLQRKRRGVVLIHRNAPAQPRALVFASTALARDGHQRLEWSGARVQSEFWCRASTPCTGLPDGQARTEAARSCPCKASLATRHLVRAEDLNAPAGEEPRVFSRASWPPGPCHARWLDFLMEK
jgi:hypothetical protein